jgi:hypothetical protein
MSGDTEVEAMSVILTALAGLDDIARERVLKYTHERCEVDYGWSERHIGSLVREINDSVVGKQQMDENVRLRARLKELEAEVAAFLTARTTEAAREPQDESARSRPADAG